MTTFVSSPTASEALADPPQRDAAEVRTLDRISVVILTAHRPQLLRRCLDSIAVAGAPCHIEILVGCNDDADTHWWLRTTRPDIVAVALREPRLGAARNELLERAEGQLIVFLDDDTVVPSTFFVDLADLARRHSDAAVFGGPNLAVPTANDFVCAQEMVLRSIHLGPVRNRFTPGAATRWSLCLCNLAVRSSLHARFDPRLTTGEETELLARLTRNGHRAIADCRLAVGHERRTTPATYLRQIFKYGHGRGQATAAPVVVSAVAGLTLNVAATRRLRTTTVWLYGAAVFATAARAFGREHSFRQASLVGALVPLTHAAYATGLAAGTVTSLKTRLSDR